MNNTVIGQGVIIVNNTVTINGVKYPFLPKMNGNNVTTINDNVYIDGYELKRGKWKRTLKALFYMVF